MFKKKVLIIDDTEFMVRLITDILTSAGYEVAHASNGLDGLRKVSEEKPDLVLLDIVMPGMSGFEVCKVLREVESNNLMPIIMLTTKDTEEDKLTCLELGADDYIVKPFNRRELLSRVNNTLRRIDRNRWANPLTGLPGNLEVQSEINHRIAKKSLFSVIYADLDNFKAFNDVYGYATADRAIKLTADIIANSVREFGTPGDFVGHIGGDDFIVVTIPDRANGVCESIIKSFDCKIRELYTMQDLMRGYIVTTDRIGQVMKYPIMSISLAVVSNEQREIINHIQISEIAAELKKEAKSIAGSVYVKDNQRY